MAARCVARQGTLVVLRQRWKLSGLVQLPPGTPATRSMARERVCLPLHLLRVAVAASAAALLCCRSSAAVFHLVVGGHAHQRLELHLRRGLVEIAWRSMAIPFQLHWMVMGLANIKGEQLCHWHAPGRVWARARIARRSSAAAIWRRAPCTRNNRGHRHFRPVELCALPDARLGAATGRHAHAWPSLQGAARAS